MRSYKTFVAALASLSLAACGGGTTNNNNNHPGGSADMAVSSSTDMATLYAPAGFTVVPYLTASADTHTYTSADQVLVQGKDYAAVIETDVGRVVIDLEEVKTPITVNSFVFLTLHHYFDGIAFHRVIDNFVAQGGDPNTLDADTSQWGSGGPGYYFGVEVMNGLAYDGPGVVGMARSQSLNSNGSQFFITLAATPSLNDKYTIFGKVIEGMDVLPKFARGTGNMMANPPTTPTRMTRVYIVSK